MRYESQRFQAQDVELDGNEFVHCSFTHCILIYRGGEFPIFNGCLFVDSPVQFKGAAGRTIGLLKVLYHKEDLSFRPIVERVFAFIKDASDLPPVGVGQDD